MYLSGHMFKEKWPLGTYVLVICWAEEPAGNPDLESNVFLLVQPHNHIYQVYQQTVKLLQNLNII